MNYQNQTKTLSWIIPILQSNKIPWFISGGFACNLYGSTRPLADIDIAVPEQSLAKLVEMLKEYATDRLSRYKDHSWDLDVITIKYQNQVIDLYGPETAKIFDKTKKKWVNLPYDFDHCENIEYKGLVLKVQPLKDILFYKSILRRGVDLRDLRELC